MLSLFPTLSGVRPLLLALSFLPLAACVVPKAQYEEAQSAVRVENAAHRRTTARLYDTDQRLYAANRALGERDRQIALLEQQLSQSGLEFSLASGERDRAATLVEQLQGELGRVGEHLTAYTEEKRALAAALKAADERVKRLAEIEREAARRARLVRDITLVLHGPITRGDGQVAIVDGKPIVRLAESSLFSGDAIGPEGRTVLKDLAQVLREVEDGRIELSERGRRLGSSEELVVRLGRVADALTEDGIAPDRVQVTLPPADAVATAPAATPAGDATATAPSDAATAPELPAAVEDDVGLPQIEIGIVTASLE